jgi:uncharacterized protein (DUF1684 family)
VIVVLASALWLAVAPASESAPPGPVTLFPAAADSIRAAIEKDREESRNWLKTSPTSYLATVRRVDFGGRERLTVGRAADNDVRLDADGVSPHHLNVTVVGDSFQVRAVDDTARFTVQSAARREAVVGPSALMLGRFTLRLSHQRFPAIIVFDPQSPRFGDYKGIEYFPVDLAWRYVLRLTRNPNPDTVIIVSTRGSQRRALRIGWFEFSVAGTRCQLEAHRLLEPGVGENDLAVFFRDATTGKETYPVGRYLDPVRLPDGHYVLDFNQAYNPACAYSEHYNCPIPSRANYLRVAVRAGERDAHYLDHAGP